MSLQTLAWLAVAAYAVHIMEEYTFDWRNWARNVIKLPVEWGDFYVTNSVVIVLGISQAMVAPNFSLAPLSYASLMLINAMFFHILPMIRTRGRYSPGVATAVLIFIPAGVAVWHQAGAESTLSVGTATLAIAAGAMLMAYPIIMLNLKSKPYFRQDRA